MLQDVRLVHKMNNCFLARRQVKPPQIGKQSLLTLRKEIICLLKFLYQVILLGEGYLLLGFRQENILACLAWDDNEIEGIRIVTYIYLSLEVHFKQEIFFTGYLTFYFNSAIESLEKVFLGESITAFSIWTSEKLHWKTILTLYQILVRKIIKHNKVISKCSTHFWSIMA